MAPLVAFVRLRKFLFPDRGVLLRAPYITVAAAAIIVGVLLAFAPPLVQVEWNLYDLYSRRLAREPNPAPSVLVVAIDEPSFAEIGLPWPWPRSLHATLIDRLVEGGARTIAFDVLFDVPGEADGELAEAMQRAGNVILAADLAAIDDRNYSLTQWTDPVAPLAKAATSLGAVRIPYDRDGVLRRAVLSIEQRPTLPLAIAQREPGFIPPDQTSDARLFAFNGTPRQGIVTVSYYQALDASASLPPGIFRNKHVIIGRSLAAPPIDEKADHFTTPVAVRMAGAEIHATVADALLRGHFIADPFDAPRALLLLCLAVGTAFAAVAFWMGPVSSPAVAAASAVLLLGAEYVFLSRGVRFPAVAPTVVLTSVYAVTAAYRFGLVTSERRLIKRAFQHYVAPAVVEKMLNDPSKLSLGGDEYEVTVLFSDLEGFTTLSERLSPAELTAHLSGYFKAMLDVVLAERGTLDKLIGDAIMAYFGAPIRDADHPAQACRAALAMQRRMVDLNGRWDAAGLPRLRTRIGVNTGPAVAGNVGTDTIFNYTLLGDCVNLASRLEGANKEYDTLILVGEDTWERLGGAFEGREVDWIRVKGKTQPVAIYELAAVKGQLDERRRAVFAAFAQGLSSYRSGHWSEAHAAFEQAMAIDPTDGPAKTFAARCAENLQRPPSAWEGVHVMKTK